MINKTTKNAIISIKKNIDAYAKEMAKLKEKIDAIDEKYRKKAEEERKELDIAYSNLEFEQDIWQSSLSRYGDDVVNEALGEVSTTEDEQTETAEVVETVTEQEFANESDSTTTEEPDKVVDSIFPENNEPEPEEPVAEEKDTELEPVFADVNVESEEATQQAKDMQDIWPTETPTEEPVAEVTDDQVMSEVSSDNDGWPEFPEQW